MPFVDPTYLKEKCGVGGQTTLLTFGLLGPNKGIEYAIRALPAVVERHPDVVYVVLGATHPNLVRERGESYRMALQHLAESLGVGANVVFHNQFVSLTELKEFRYRMRRTTYRESRNMVWAKVAEKYHAAFGSARNNRAAPQRSKKKQGIRLSKRRMVVATVAG